MSTSVFIYALLAGLLPSLIWLWFWLREDSAHPEPRWLLVGSFFGGMLAVTVAVFAEKYIADIVNDPSLRYTAWAAVEEILKFIFVGIIALSTSYNDEPMDAMIYCIVAALGFAALENTLFVMGPLSGGEIAKGILTSNMRFIGATLVHVVSSAIIGCSFGYVFYKGYIAKIIAVTVGLFAAVALHASFNLSIINASTTSTLKAFGWVWGAVVILIVLFEEIKAVKPKYPLKINN